MVCRHHRRTRHTVAQSLADRTCWKAIWTSNAPRVAGKAVRVSSTDAAVWHQQQSDSPANITHSALIDSTAFRNEPRASQVAPSTPQRTSAQRYAPLVTTQRPATADVVPAVSATFTRCFRTNTPSSSQPKFTPRPRAPNASGSPRHTTVKYDAYPQ
jgi:hypothetical protein